MAENVSTVELDGGRPIWVVLFSADGEYLVSGDDKAVRVWRTADGKKVATMTAYDVRSIALSKDGRFIAAGTELGRVAVWDAHTHERTFTHKENGSVRAVDFSHDSTRLVAASGNCTVSVWDLAGCKLLGPLHHQQEVVAAKYSLQGDRIATYDLRSIRVYDSSSGQLLTDIPADVAIYCNTGLAWSTDGHYLFVVSDGKIKQLRASTGSTVLEWPVHDYQSYACLVLSMRGEFIAYSSNRTVNFLDTSSGSQLGQVIKHDQDVHSIALSPDDQFLASSTGDGIITIRSLQDVLPIYSISGPFIYAGGTVFDSWKQGQLVKTEGLLTEDTNREKSNYHALAYRALIRARLRQWEAAGSDAEKSIEIQPSVIGHIAKAVALIGEGKKGDGYRACDLAFKYCRSDHVDSLLALKAVVVCMAGEYADAILRVGDLIATTRDNSVYYTLQAYMYFLCGNSRFEHKDYEGAIQSLERALAQVRRHTSRCLWTVSLISGWQFDGLDIMIQRHLCEALYATGRAKQAEDLLLKMINTPTQTTSTTEPIAQWMHGFIERYLSTPENSKDLTSKADRVSMSSLGPSASMLLVAEWVRVKSASTSWRDILAAAVGFSVPRIIIYQAVCEHLETTDCVTDATDCFYQMANELTITHDEEVNWVLDFKQRCSRKLEDLGDVATNAQRHDQAISQYSAALALNPTICLLVKRGKAHVANGSSKDALHDAIEIIELDPSSPLGYEIKHAALRGEGRYTDAIDAFETMLTKMSQSSDPEIRERSRQYVKPKETTARIRLAVQDTVRGLPRALIDTVSGRLLNKSEQASTFESSPAFTELVSSMTTRIDTTRIKHEVVQYYRYAILSHVDEEDEPLFENVAHIVVYDLEPSLTHDKLRVFCRTVRDSGFRWAWSDTCCINKSIHFELQEAMVAMFRWHQGSALVIAFLRGVRSPSTRGDLLRSTWNSRPWTLQAYHASRVVQFYTEDWMPYLNLDLPNHKESPEIISEMEEATGLSSRALRALRPGLDNIREKLSLASRRQAANVEDVAYSLFGIFSVSLPIAYGEGDKALGRLLAHLLSSSGDTSILAWTGKSGTFNSCLPADISVFNQSPASHIPPAFADTTIDIAKLYTSSLNLTMVTRLHDRLDSLSVPSVSGKRISMPCVTFRLEHLSRISKHSLQARADALGIVEIRIAEDLKLDSAYIVHPWIDFLLDRQPRGEGNTPTEMADRSLSHGASSSPGTSNNAWIDQRTPIVDVVTRIWQSFSGLPAPPSPSLASLTDRRTRALQFVGRLRQPFGALLLTPTYDNPAEFRRVATDSMITVRIQQDTPLDSLLPNVRMVDLV